MTNAKSTDQVVKGAELTLLETGERVRVVAVDSDPRATVWVCFVEDPDRDAHVTRAALGAA